jgi:hypothetical protein
MLETYLLLIVLLISIVDSQIQSQPYQIILQANNKPYSIDFDLADYTLI